MRRLGAKAAIGSVEDVGFLTKTFTGADAVYTMVPPNFGVASNWKKYIGQVLAKITLLPLRSSGVKNLVNLSSIGAHMPVGCGPVQRIVYFVEKAFNGLEGVNVRHLRPGFFYAKLPGQYWYDQKHGNHRRKLR